MNKAMDEIRGNDSSELKTKPAEPRNEQFELRFSGSGGKSFRPRTTRLPGSGAHALLKKFSAPDHKVPREWSSRVRTEENVHGPGPQAPPASEAQAQCAM